MGNPPDFCLATRRASPKVDALSTGRLPETYIARNNGNANPRGFLSVTGAIVVARAPTTKVFTVAVHSGVTLA
jgi:hypothetical protein